MNNTQLKVKIQTANPNYSTQGKLIVKGQCLFKFYDNKETHTEILYYQAYGQAAVALNEAGVGSVFVLIGRINVYPPNEDNINHLTILNVENAVCIKASTSKQPVAVSPITTAAQRVPVAATTAQRVPVAATTAAKPVRQGASSVTAVATQPLVEAPDPDISIDDIPF